MSCYAFMNKFLPKKIRGQQSTIEMPISEEDAIQALKLLLDEKKKELKKKDDAISLLEKKLDEKDNLIRHLQNEIDKFRQVVRPLTQKIITKQISLGDEIWMTNSVSPGVENTRVQGLVEPRIKRQAISAEPLNLKGADYQIKKIPKSTISRELIKAAILDNDFMKNLELTQIKEIVDCMYPEAYKKGSIIITEGDVGSIVYVLEGKKLNHYNVFRTRSGDEILEYVIMLQNGNPDRIAIISC
ncbi:hypothetical protein HHI36_014637 [Cryptolaemus montrouzieri]|uniref:cAMP-dependent protein kinase type II-alpha regulatory subunit n=1 Tax=Cryptolaemus montrouzieri TaxID=559131 RepID=A0ABD2N3C7_9CUCU